MDARESGQMGLLTLGYYVTTTVLAAIVSLFEYEINYTICYRRA